jgi:hypothetical protein
MDALDQILGGMFKIAVVYVLVMLFLGALI